MCVSDIKTTPFPTVSRLTGSVFIVSELTRHDDQNKMTSKIVVCVGILLFFLAQVRVKTDNT